MEALQAFASARLAQGLAQAETAQAATVAALSKPQAKYLFFAAFYVCWQLLKLTLLRRVLPALARCLRRVPQLHVPLTADEADAAPKGAKWVRARPELRPAGALNRRSWRADAAARARTRAAWRPQAGASARIGPPAGGRGCAAHGAFTASSSLRVLSLGRCAPAGPVVAAAGGVCAVL
jgi:hypothetical protein